MTYFTVSTHRFFLGTVALLNSLRLTGNAGELVVLDAGLTPDERELLERSSERSSLLRTRPTSTLS